MKKFIIAIAFSASLLSFQSCTKDRMTEQNIKDHFKGNLLYRWETYQLMLSDRTLIQQYDQPWINQVTFRFFADGTGWRDNGTSAFPSLPRRQNFTWSQLTAVAYQIVDPVTKKFNIVYVDTDREVLTITETEPVYQQYICRKVHD